MMTPFSGLSLIIHLTVIGVGKIIDALRNRIVRRPRALPESGQLTNPIWSKIGGSIASVSIVLVLSAIMVTSFGVALQTSVREGASEWQRQAVANMVEELRYSLENNVENYFTKFSPLRDRDAANRLVQVDHTIKNT